MADVLPADEVAEIRNEWSGSVHEGAILRLCDSHEALRATVARLRTAADDLLDALTRSDDQAHEACFGCGRFPDGPEPKHLAPCPVPALRAALDATTAGEAD